MKQQLTTDRLLLRKIESGDKHHILAGISQGNAAVYYGTDFPSGEPSKQQMDWFESMEREGSAVWWAVCSEDNQTFYGAGGLNSLSEVHRKAEISFWLLPEFRERGIMNEALSRILEYGFSMLNLHRIEGFVEAGNHACRKGIEKLGFRHEGTMKDAEIKQGRFVSIEIYALLKSEWRDHSNMRGLTFQ